MGLKLSSHFSLAELTRTSTGKNNVVPASLIENGILLARTLEQVRAALGSNYIRISSGYRSEEVNKAVKGAKGSMHLQFLAADFTCPDFGSPKKIIQTIIDSKIKFDQLINEHDRWVHIGVGGSWRNQVLTIDKKGTREGLYDSRA